MRTWRPPAPGSQRASVGFTCHKRHVSLKELASGDSEMAVAPEKIDIKLNINGHDYAARVEPRKTLVDVIRDECGLTGTHIGCEHGVCGACTVRLDGVAVRSCLLLAVQADECAIETVEGLARDGELNALQTAFRECHALQCGFCTPGILMAALDFVERHPGPSRRDVEDMLSGHLCRCTGYEPIVRAILSASGKGSA